MSGKKNPARARRARVIKVAPVTRAVRLALAATTLALAGSGAAYAGTCSDLGNNTVQCLGAFADTIAYPDVVDLTLVVGDGSTPTSVTPAIGNAGIDVTGDGAIDVTNYADISTYGADGIHAYSGGSLGVTNNGTVYTEVTGFGQEGIDASAMGDVDVANNGLVVAYGSVYDVTAVRAETFGCGCTVTVENGASGQIVAEAGDGGAIGIYAYAQTGTAHVGNDGFVLAESYGGLADGIFAAGDEVGVRNGGTVVAEGYTWAAGIEVEANDVASVRNGGDIYAYTYGYGGRATGIYATAGTGGATVDNLGGIRAQGFYATGIDASALGDVTVTNSGVIQAGSTSYTLYGVGIHAGSNGEGGVVAVDNTGDIEVASYYGSTGIEVVATGEGASGSASNAGTISTLQASKYGSSAGIVVSADGDAHVDNSGSITVVQGGGETPPLLGSEGFTPYFGGSAYGAIALSFNGDASVTNTGDIHVTSMPFGYAAGVVAASQNGDAGIDNGGLVQSYGKYAYGLIATSGAGDVTVHNGEAGEVEALSLANMPYAFAGAMGGIATEGDVTVDNAGYALAVSYGSAIAAFGLSGQGDVTESNSGELVAVAYGSATGMFGRADYGTASVDNAGSVTALAYADGGSATGLFARSTYGTAAVGNSGDVLVQAYYGNATGLLSVGATANATNGGTVSAYGYQNAYGIEAIGTDLADIANDGSVLATAYTGNAIGVLGLSTAGDVSISGSGSVTAYAPQVAIGLYAYAAGNVTVDNGGDVLAVSDGSLADGIFAAGYDVDVSSDGSIIAAGYTWAAGIEAEGGDSVAIHNAGDIGAYATGYGAQATGIHAVGGTGGATVDNAGGIRAQGFYATGIDASALGDVTVTNSGVIQAGSTSYTLYGVGIHAGSNGEGGVVAVDNTGDIEVASYYGSTGIEVVATGEGASGSASNAGTISTLQASKYGSSAGIVVSADGDAHVDNSGSITVVQGGGETPPLLGSEGFTPYFGGSAYGAIALSFNGDASVTNTGDIHVTSMPFGYAAGVVAASQNGDAGIDNGGLVQSYGKYAYGLIATSGAGDVTVHNGEAGEVEALSLANMPYAFAGAMGGIATEGDVTVDNAGYALAVSYGSAIAAFGLSGQGDVTESNSGELVAVAYGSATGMFGRADYGTASVDNAGSVTALAYADGGSATGLFARSDYGTAAVGNNGDVLAQAYYGNATGLLSVGATANATNGGTVSAYGYQNAYGVEAIGTDLAEIANDGSVLATAYTGNAIGVLGLSTAGDVSISGSGSVTAYAPQVAIGLYAYAAGNAIVDNGGDVLAVSAAGQAFGAYVAAMDANVDNSGTLTGRTTDGTAIGLAAISGGDLDIHNSGTIAAYSDGTGSAIGLYAFASGVLHVDNDGVITAGQADGAVAVSLNAGASILRNTGTIRTDATVEGQVAVQGGMSVEQVLNYGQLDGALLLGGGDDLMFNGAGGVWTVGNHATDFGDGDDTLAIGGGVVDVTRASVAFGAGDDAVAIGSGGTLRLHRGALYLGDSSADGNSFTNSGRIQVIGTGNLIDMGAGPAAGLAASTNPLALVNNGVIDFVDGAPDDVLTINGDLGGSGLLRIDLRTLAGTSDLLYVDGDVVDDAVQTVDVDFGGAPTAAMLGQSVAFAHVSGASAAGSFVGGKVIGWDAGDFLDLQVGVTSQIDANGAAADVFSVGVTAAGLTDPGTLAASVGAGAQTLVNAQIGTWRQRMGVLADRTVGLGPWARYFSDAGNTDPGHAASNFGAGGNFGFHQSNSGWEVGLNARPGAHLDFGVLVAKSEGRQHLREGSGTDRLDGRTFGLYGTWTSDRFYVDASARWMGFDADIRSGAIHQRTSGEADSVNIEAGFNAWTLGDGLSLQPQVQYTRTWVESDAIHGGLATFQADDADSSRGRIGLAVSKTMTSGGWTWMPYGSVNAVREFDGKYAYAIDNGFFGSTSTKGTSALVELGAGARKGRLSVTGGVNWTDGGALDGLFGGQVLVHYNW